MSPPYSLGVVTGNREGGTVEKAEGQLVWPQSGEGPQRARKTE